jgi:cysteine desulfurase/selenocysteine lyase
MLVDWDKIRNEYFPALKNYTYIMAASASPMNKNAYEEGLNYLNTMLKHGDIHYEQFEKDCDQNRQTIANYIKCSPEEIAFIPNVSSGMNIIARMLEKAEFIYPSVEFPASIHIFKRMGFSNKKINPINNKYPIENIRNAVSLNTKIVIHSHVQSLTGFRQNLEMLGNFCKENSLFSVINTTQSFGSFNIDVKRFNIDMMVCNALKWVGCGYGAGVLYINKDMFKDSEIPFSGWLSVRDPFTMDNENIEVINETRYMDVLGGCPNYGALLALKGSFDFIKEQIGKGNIRNGIKKIQERILHLTQFLIDRIQDFDITVISPLESEFRSGIITIEHSRAEKIYDSLIKNNIFLSLKKYPASTINTLLRFSLNYYNNEEDIEKVIEVFKTLDL